MLMRDECAASKCHAREMRNLAYSPNVAAAALASLGHAAQLSKALLAVLEVEVVVRLSRQVLGVGEDTGKIVYILR